MYSKYIWNFQN